ncbi:MAG: Hpt domain-containing protein [Holophagaceae bacterium]|nr:Hpt domain-containing protein [Holophagaceae bacterium]
MNDLPVLDPQPLRDLLDLGASPALVQELIALFQEDVPARLALLQRALCARDAQQTMMEAHQLKGALSNLGLVRFAESASRIEAQARRGQLDDLPLLVEALPKAYEDGLAALHSAFPGS